MTAASPHTRGWTPSRGADRPGGTGFPAHAGMDPGSIGSFRAGPGLPRTRGDGPPLSVSVAGRKLASPHTRGWTRRRRAGPGRGRGFPAHAGMDPSRCGAGWPGPRLPRTRGDGPGSTMSGSRPAGASPHTRGWTHAEAADHGRARGFPAHAGMDPRPACRARAAGWLPRTRGDGPLQDGPRDDPLEASPHTRGWTRGRRPARGADHGFPAHAGMDLRRGP